MNLDFSRQPLAGSDIAAFVFSVLAVLFFVLRWRDRERGMSWLALAYALLAIQYFLDGSTLPTGSRVNPIAALLLSTGGSAFSIGMVYYLSAPHSPKQWQVGCALLPALIPPAAALLGIELHRPWSYAPYAVSLFVVVKVALDATRREPQAGHLWLAFGLLIIPVALTTAIAFGIETFHARYYVLPPAIFFGIMLLTVSLLRRSKALEAENARRLEAEHALTVLNASLERTVAQRTADLQNIVSGLESFNRNVSHDLRGSLGGMSGLARIALEGLQHDDDSVARRVLPLIEKQASQSAEMVTALLALAKVSDQDVRKAPVDLDALTREVISSVELTRLSNASPRFVVNSLPRVHADPALLRPVLINLIGNAVKFCSARPDACIEVRAQRNLSDTIVQVRDNGVGFSTQRAERLFEPFTRLHGQEFAGHGVGLSIVRRAIERHGGRVWAESESGKGASFFFSLPDASDAFGSREPMAAE